MNLYRVALGITIMAMLIPVAAVAVPGWFEDDPTEPQPVARAFEAVTPQESRALESSPRNSGFQLDGPGSLPNSTGASSDSTTTSSEAQGESTTSSSLSKDSDNSSTSTSVSSSTSSTSKTTNTSTPKATSTTKPKTTTTTEPSSPGPTAPPPPPANVGATLTGNVCPCSVSGTTELKGTVNLKGDLMVNGGTLVARPGVTVNGNGFQIMFMNGGKADFQGSKTSTWSNDGKTVNLTRDIKFKNMRRIMFHGAAKSTLKYFSVTDSGTPTLGDYPIHFHLNGNSTRGTLVEGVVVLNSPNRAFVPHGSHGITFRHTIAKNIRRDAYWWDRPGTNGGSIDNSNDITYDHALALNVHLEHGVSGYHRNAAFELGKGTGNVIKNSVARDTKGGKDCSGFHWPENREGTWGFFNNAAFGGSCNGIFVWQNTSNDHVINGFRGNKIENGAYRNQYNFFDIDVAAVESHALGKTDKPVIFDGGSIGAVSIPRHQAEGDPIYFRNLTIGSFHINNGSGGNTPGTYILENTNLKCGDISYGSVVSGTKVIIDGKEC